MLQVVERAGVRAEGPPILDERTFSVCEVAGEELGEIRLERRRGKGERKHPGDYRYFQVTNRPKAKRATLCPARAVAVDPLSGELVIPVRAKAVQHRPRCSECAARGRTRRRCPECWELRRRERRPVEAAKPESEARAKRRAMSQMELYCRECQLDHMWTFTNTEEWATFDRAEMLRRMEVFGREWAASTKSRRYPDGRPWMAVLELHPRGHGWHVHFCVHGFVPWQKLVACWPYGRVQTPEGPDGKTLAGWFDPVYVARYLSDYVSKDLGEGRTALGQHRYLKAKAMRPYVQRHVALGWDDGYQLACVLYGGVPPAWSWSSESLPDERWKAPPVAVFDWWVIDREGRRRRPGGSDGQSE